MKSFFIKSKGALVGLIFVIFLVVIGLMAPLLAPHAPEMIFEGKLKLPFFWMAGGDVSFPLGTDDVGRCLLSRLLYGAQTSLSVGLLIVIFSSTVGTFLGLIAGYFQGYIDVTLSRIMDLFIALPSMLLAMLVVALLGPGLLNAIIAVGLVGLPGFFRLIRAQTMTEKARPYVLASQSFGASSWRQLFLNILPNCMAPLIVQITLGVSNGILDTAALGFLGLGAQAPTAEWGTMLADAKAYLESYPRLVILPGLCILITVVSLNLLGDGLRDALDPKLKRSE